MTKETGATLDDVVLQLKINNYLLAALLKPDNEDKEHNLLLRLASADVPHVHIAELLGRTPNAIDVALSRERLKDKKPHEPDGKKKV